MWKCKWGCDLFHHRAALSGGGKPASAASSKVLSKQISDVIASINEPRTQSFAGLGRVVVVLRRGRNQGWTKSCEAQSHETDKCRVSGCVKTSTQRKRKQISEVGDVQVSDVQRPKPNVHKVLQLLQVTFGGLCQMQLRFRRSNLKFVFPSGS